MAHRDRKRECRARSQLAFYPDPPSVEFHELPTQGQPQPSAATGRVSGNIKTDSLVVAKGACFTGNVTKINEEPAATATYLPLYVIEHKLAEQTGDNSPEMKRQSVPVWSETNRRTNVSEKAQV